MNPWASEICGDNIDQDCSGQMPSAQSAVTSTDRDGFGQGEGCFGFDPTTETRRLILVHAMPNDGIDRDCGGADLMIRTIAKTETRMVMV